MFFRKILALFFIGFLFFGLIGGFGRNGGFDAGYDAAYRQGFLDGQQAAAGAEAPKAAESAAETGAPAAPAVPGTQVYVRDRGFFLPTFAFLLCLAPLFFIGLSFLGFGRHGRRRQRGSWGPCGPDKRAWKHGAWQSGDNSPQEKSPEDIDDGPRGPVMQA